MTLCRSIFTPSSSLALLLPLVGCSGDDSSTSMTTTESVGTSVATAATTTGGTDATGTTATSSGSSTDSTASATDATTTSDTESTGVSATDSTTSAGTTSAGTSSGTSEGTSEGTSDTSTTTGEEFCPEGQILCDGNTAQTCDGMGGFMGVKDCGDDVCVEGLGCLLCVPLQGSCDGDKASFCNEAGDGYVEDLCDPVQGQSCDANTGQCAGACSKAAIGLSYIGCDYYPTVLPQHDSYNTAPKDVFAVSVSNTTNQVAKVTVTRGAMMVATDTVPANSVKVVNLPWINETTKGGGPSKVVVDGAYRLRSDQPVTVYQYNPLGATTTNDASLLLPVNAWTPNTMVSAWGGGFYAVVAAQDDTTLNLSPSTTGNSVSAGAGVNANGTGQVKLNEGDILVVHVNNDATGTIIKADKPIEGFGGHKCTTIPPGACDHLEEASLPIEALAKEYVIAPTAQFPNPALDKPQFVRIIASEDNTSLVFEPDQPVAKTLAKAGDWVQLASSVAHFKVVADKKVMVTQYMVGQSANTGNSDPAFVTAIPVEQFRTNYLIFAATSWQANFVDVIAPTGASVQIDGVTVNAWKAIGNSGYAVAHVQLSNAGNGNHTVVADKKVGISVYGVQNYGSYWYPGGTDLTLIPQ